MKKLMITAAAVACASMVVAQTTTSQNIVGYTKVTATGGELSLVALNFTPDSTDVNDLIGAQLPVGSVLHIWDKSSGGYNSIQYTSSRAGSSWPAATIDIGDSFWIEASGVSTHDVILAGEVKGDALSTTIGGTGSIDATGYHYPIAATWGDTDLSVQLGAGAVLHLWTGSNYVTHVKTTSRAGTDWTPEAKLEVLDPAEGFWIETPNQAWTEALPYTP